MSMGHEPDIEQHITHADARSLAEKLREFGAALPPAEQVILAGLFHRATASADDGLGFAWAGRLFANFADHFLPGSIICVADLGIDGL